MARKKSSPSQEKPEHVRCYESHGVSFHKEEGKEWKGTCPFCDGSAFFVNTDEGLFSCKTCDKSGNKYNFLQAFYDFWLSQTTSKRLKMLSKDREIPVDAFELAEVAWDNVNKVWLIPHRNQKGSMVNLGRWSPSWTDERGHRPILNAATCKAHMYNVETIGDMRRVYVCEGQWDAIALQWLFHKNEVKDAAVVAVPGASMAKEEWGSILNKREVYLLYDNDEPGVKGREAFAEMLRKYSKVRSIHSLEWPESYPEKYDVRDHVSSGQKKPKKALSDLLKLFSDQPLHTEKSSGLVRETFASVIKDFEKHIHLTPEMKDALLVICSVILSNKIFQNPFCPLWMFIVGPSGSGKTLLLQSTSDLDMVSFQTTLTPKTLVSGYKTHDGSDPSLLPLIIGKTLVIEDFTGIMTLSSGDQDEIHGVLRSCYNGRYEKPFGHVGLRVYPEPDSGHETCHFSILAGVTSDIHADRRANHGERFLKFRMKAADNDQEDQIRAAVKNTVREVAPELELRKSITAFIEHKFTDDVTLPEVPRSVEDKIVGLAQVVSMVQAVVIRKSGELLIRPESGVGSRISQQLIKLGQAAAYTLGKKKLDDEIYRLIKLCGLHTCHGWHLDMLMAVSGADQKKGISRVEIQKEQKISGTTVHRCLEDLLELDAVEFDLEETGKKGQPTKLWKLTPLMVDLFKRAGIPVGPVKRQLRKKSTVKKGAKRSVKKKATR